VPRKLSGLDVAVGEPWTFAENRTLAEVIADETIVA
jgi:hypothetical protein